MPGEMRTVHPFAVVRTRPCPGIEGFATQAEMLETLILEFVREHASRADGPAKIAARVKELHEIVASAERASYQAHQRHLDRIKGCLPREERGVPRTRKGGVVVRAADEAPGGVPHGPRMPPQPGREPL